MSMYRAFGLIPQEATQQKPRRPYWCSRQKSLIKILLNWNINMTAVTPCANALYVHMGKIVAVLPYYKDLYVTANQRLSIARFRLTPIC